TIVNDNYFVIVEALSKNRGQSAPNKRFFVVERYDYTYDRACHQLSVSGCSSVDERGMSMLRSGPSRRLSATSRAREVVSISPVARHTERCSHDLPKILLRNRVKLRRRIIQGEAYQTG